MFIRNYQELKPIWHRWRHDIILAFVGINLLAIFTYLGYRDDLLHPISIFLSLMVVAFGFFFYAAISVERRVQPFNRSLFVLIVLFGAVFRLVLVHSFPSLSTDIYRYIWDGRLTCHWINPYRWSPWDPRLAEYRDNNIWQPMEYKAYSTVYMPISQLAFAICYAVFRESLAAFKLVFTLCDIGIVLLIGALLRRLGKDPARVIWYAWCPLPIVEVALAGHQDVIGVLCLLAALLFMLKANSHTAAFWLAAAGLTKGFALLLLPLFVRFKGRNVAGVIVVTMLYFGLPLWVYLPEFLHGMQQYLNYVHVNAGLFSWIDWALCFATPWHYAITSKLSDIAIFCAIVWSVWSKPATIEEVIRRAIIVISTCLLVVPTLFPWYLIWVLPLVTLYGKTTSRAAFAFALMVNLVYIYYVDRSIEWWVSFAEYLPVYVLIVWEVKRGYWSAAVLETGGSNLSGRIGSSSPSEIESAGLSTPLDTDVPSPARSLGLDVT